MSLNYDIPLLLHKYRNTALSNKHQWYQKIKEHHLAHIGFSQQNQLRPSRGRFTHQTSATRELNWTSKHQ